MSTEGIHLSLLGEQAASASDLFSPYLWWLSVTRTCQTPMTAPCEWGGAPMPLLAGNAVPQLLFLNSLPEGRYPRRAAQGVVKPVPLLMTSLRFPQERRVFRVSH